MKVVNRSKSVNHVYSIIDDIQEQQQVSQEISEAISNPANLPASHQYDHDELLAELEDLEREDLSSSFPSTSLNDTLYFITCSDRKAKTTAAPPPGG
uniref:Uncharacterized protein n=1 Tax=Plectus sambesii TaxID=2011161 RepID=A0A914W700_9BILA